MIRERLPDWFRAWLGRLGTASMPDERLPSRRERRAVVRDRAAAGGSAWSDEDRHLNPDGAREVADLTPGTPGSGGRRRIG